MTMQMRSSDRCVVRHVSCPAAVARRDSSVIADRDPSVRAKLARRAQETPNVGGTDPGIAALAEHHAIDVEHERARRQPVGGDDEHVGHVQVGVTRAGTLECT